MLSLYTIKKEINMSEIDKDFLKEVFNETNAHLRNTEQKSMMVTGGYIALFSLMYTSFVKDGSLLENQPWVEILGLVFFMFIGSCIHILQQWYRAWKVHYIEVCIEIRKQFITNDENLNVLPYWLRTSESATNISIDNILKYLTIIINLIILIITSYKLFNLFQNIYVAFLSVIFLVSGYFLLLYFTDKSIRKNSKLGI